MKPAPFEYERAIDLESALSALARFGKRAKVLAGGQSLIPMLNLRLASAERLIDVGRLNELRYIRVAGNELRIGALTTHNAVLGSPEIAEHCPIMVEAYRLVSHHSVRNRGTIGGSLCHNDPASEMPLVVNLLGAILIARSASGERAIAADQFFKGNFETALDASELLAEIRVPIPAKGHGWSFQEVSQRKGDYALVAAGAMLAIDGGVCRQARLGFRNVGETIFRMPAIEARIEGQAPSPALFSAAGKAAMNAVDPPSDLHADEAYRRDLVKVLTERVLATAVARARR
jgi:aerobic carbon-monoxide dehydrogenase medium subunit